MFVAGLLLLAGTQGSAAIGLSSLFVAMMVGSILLGLPGGALADRLGAGRALVLGAIGRTLVIAVALGTAGQPHALPIIAFAYSAISQLYTPAELALVRTVAPHRPAGAHTLLVALQHAGQGIGILVLAPAAFFLGGAEAMIGAGLVTWIGVSGLAMLIARSGLLAQPVGTMRRAVNFAGTFRYFTQDPHAAYAAPVIAFSEMAAKATIIALPLYLAHDLRLDALEPAAILIPGAVGALLGLVWAGRVLHLQLAPQAMRLTLAGTAVSAVALAGLGNGIAFLSGVADLGPIGYFQNAIHLSVAVALPVALLLGMCFIVAPIAASTVLTATAPPGEQGRVFATQGMLTDVLAIVPLVIAGVGAELAGARATFLFLGALGAALFVGLEMVRMRKADAVPLRPRLEGAAGQATEA